MRNYIGADHVGFYLKEALKEYLIALGHRVTDIGAPMYIPEDDYPDYVFPVVQAVASGSADRGIVIGSSGEGEGIAANRIHGIRAFVYYGSAKPLSHTSKVGEAKDLITVSREDNDSNVLSLGASFVSPEEAKKVVEQWLSVPFTGEERHIRRIKKIDNI